MKTSDTPIAIQETTHVCPQCGGGTVVFAIDALSTHRAGCVWRHACGYEHRHGISRRLALPSMTSLDVFDAMERVYQSYERQGFLLPDAWLDRVPETE